MGITLAVFKIVGNIPVERDKLLIVARCLDIYHTWVILGAAYRHKLKHSLLGVPRKIVLLKFENIKRDEWY